MPNKTVVLDLGNKVVHNLRFGAMGALLLSEHGITIHDLTQKVENNSLEFRELQYLLWAELESARKKDRVHPVPWTIDAVCDLIDDACDGDIVEFWKRYGPAIVEAFRNSFHLTIAAHETLTRRAAELAAAGAKTGGEDRPTPAAKSIGDTPSTGTTALTMPRASRSRRKSSGG